MDNTTELLDENALTTALSAVAMRLRNIITHEVHTNPEIFADLLEPEINKPDPALAAMADMVANIEDGKDIKHQYAKIGQLIHNQSARAELFASLIQTHDYGRMVKFMAARQRVETVLLAVAERGKLNPGDALAMLEYLSTEIQRVEKKVASNAVSSKDVAGLLAKVDYLAQIEDSTLANQLKGTTPQNREIIRRMAHKIGKAAAAAGM